MTWAPAALLRVGWPRRSPRCVRPRRRQDPLRQLPHRRPKPGSPPSLRDWFGVLAMSVGLFMAIMDVQIVTSSLTQIQGGLSASADEISWVQTAYLIADVVMVPLSGTLSRLLSTRVLFVTATLGFTAASGLVRDSDQPQPDDHLPRDTGVLRRRHHAERVSGRLHAVPRAAADPADGDDLGDPEPVIDLGPDDRRLPDRHLLLALAVSRQHRARHCRRRGRLGVASTSTSPTCRCCAISM